MNRDGGLPLTPGPATTVGGAIEIDHPRAPHGACTHKSKFIVLAGVRLRARFGLREDFGIGAESASTWTWRNFRTESEKRCLA